MNKAYHDLVILLSRGISQRRMYFEDHPQVRACAEKFSFTLAKLQQQDGKGSFFLGVANGKLIHEGKYLIGPSIVGSKLNVFATLLQCGGFLFNKGITTGEMRLFFTMAASQTIKLNSLTEARQLFRSKNITAIELSPPYEDADWFGQMGDDQPAGSEQESDREKHWEELLPTFQSLYSTVETAHEAGQSGRSLDMSATRGTSEMLVQATEGRVIDIMQMVHYPDFNTYTVGHSVRVAMFAVMVGHYLNLPKNILNDLGVAGLLHDIGKSRIPGEILFKPGRLDQRERNLIEQHTVLGAELLLENNSNNEMAIAAAWGHHRRYDQLGYPAMPLGSKESPFTQIVNVCDVFEALTAIRPYKKGHTARKAFEIMLSDQGWFCPMALSAFCSAVGLYPAGSQVILTSGHQAQVVEPGEIFDKPKVKLTHAPDGQDLNSEAQVEVNLSTNPSRVAVQELLVLS